jgi:predicted ATP-grasp superfamily ATP-dependent carboligase
MKKSLNKYVLQAVILGNHTQGLGIIRSASKCQMPVKIIMIDDRKYSCSKYSKYLNSYEIIKRGAINQFDDPENERALMNKLIQLANHNTKSVLFPVNEDLIRIIYKNRKQLNEMNYFIPHNSISQLIDKYQMITSLPAEYQIETWLLSEKPLNELKPDKYILKGREGNAFRNFTKKKALVIANLDENLLNKIIHIMGSDNIIIQRLINSKFPVRSYCSFAVNGQVKLDFQYEKIRQHPSPFGTGSYLKSIRNPDIERISKDMLQKITFTGISEIELILDQETGTHKIIEINPRTWKSIHFATQCGHNMVAAYLEYVAGLVLKNNSEYLTEMYWCDILADLLHALRKWNGFKYNKVFFECIWDKNDPKPFISQILRIPFIGR